MTQGPSLSTAAQPDHSPPQPAMRRTSKSLAAAASAGSSLTPAARFRRATLCCSPATTLTPAFMTCVSWGCTTRPSAGACSPTRMPASRLVSRYLRGGTQPSAVSPHTVPRIVTLRKTQNRNGRVGRE